MKKMNNLTSFSIDSSYLDLCQKYTALQLAEIERQTADESDRVVFIWKNIIIYHYEEFILYTKNSVKFKIHELDFKTKNDVALWICTQELKRNDLTLERKKYLIGKRYSYSLKILSEQGMNINVSNTIKEIARDYEISHATVYKYYCYANAIDVIKQRSKCVADRILYNELKISHENVLNLANLSKDDFYYLKSTLCDKQRTKFVYSDIRYEIRINKTQSHSEKASDENLLPIKQMPKYDPDARIMSLSLTIPSWISSIRRAYLNTDFMCVSLNTKEKIKKELVDLQTVINNAVQNITEEKAI